MAENKPPAPKVEQPNPQASKPEASSIQTGEPGRATPLGAIVNELRKISGQPRETLQGIANFGKKQIEEQRETRELQRQTNELAQEVIQRARNSPNLQFRVRGGYDDRGNDYVIEYRDNPQPGSPPGDLVTYSEYYEGVGRLEGHLQVNVDPSTEAQAIRKRGTLRQVSLRRSSRHKYDEEGAMKDPGSSIDVVLSNEGSNNRPTWKVDKAERGEDVEREVEVELSKSHPYFGREYIGKGMQKKIVHEATPAKNLQEVRQLTTEALAGV